MALDLFGHEKKKNYKSMIILYDLKIPTSVSISESITVCKSSIYDYFTYRSTLMRFICVEHLLSYKIMKSMKLWQVMPIVNAYSIYVLFYKQLVVCKCDFGLSVYVKMLLRT